MRRSLFLLMTSVALLGWSRLASPAHAQDAPLPGASEPIVLEGVLEASGNYFTDLRLEIDDPDKGVYRVRPWLPRGVAQSQGDKTRPLVLADMLGKRVRIVGRLETGPLKGIGAVRYVRVISAEILGPK